MMGAYRLIRRREHDRIVLYTKSVMPDNDRRPRTWWRGVDRQIEIPLVVQLVGFGFDVAVQIGAQLRKGSYRARLLQRRCAV